MLVLGTARTSVRHEVQLYLVNESLTLNMLTQHIKYRVLSEYQVRFLYQLIHTKGATASLSAGTPRETLRGVKCEVRKPVAMA